MHNRVTEDCRFSRVIEYFGNWDWFYIKHPKLNYQSPISWLKTGKDTDTIINLIEEDTREF